VLFGFALLTGSVYAQDEGETFVYVNNNNNDVMGNPAPNTVSAFSVLPGGALATVTGSPFATGGTGGLNFIASHRVTTATLRRSFLFASNGGSNNISVFKIKTDTGRLTLLGSPVSSGGLSGGMAISLAATPNGRYLYAGNQGSNNIVAFKIESSGALTSIGSIAAGGQPDGMKVSPNGKFLGVALPGLNKVAMFTIAPNGTLTGVPSSPFSAAGNSQTGIATDVEFNCKSKLLFDAKGGQSVDTEVAVFKIASNGALSQIIGSPFTFTSGSSNSNVGLLTPDNGHLLVSNQGSNTITSLDVASDGSLTLEAMPFVNSGGSFPQDEGTNREGNLLYVSNGVGNNTVTAFHIDSDGGLTPLTPMNAFPTGGTGLYTSLTVFPAHEDEGGGDEVDDRGRKGHFDFEADHECADSGEMHFRDDSGNEMKGKVSAANATGNTAIISGSGTLADSTPVQYTAIVTGNAPVVGLNQFAISWISATGSVFQTSGALTNGYIAVHP
jgi:6-phosphogluconolactonase (cycloisomerase 2 family)